MVARLGSGRSGFAGAICAAVPRSLATHRSRPAGRRRRHPCQRLCCASLVCARPTRVAADLCSFTVRLASPRPCRAECVVAASRLCEGTHETHKARPRPRAHVNAHAHAHPRHAHRPAIGVQNYPPTQNAHSPLRIDDRPIDPPTTPPAAQSHAQHARRNGNPASHRPRAFAPGIRQHAPPLPRPYAGPPPGRWGAVRLRARPPWGGSRFVPGARSRLGGTSSP